MTSRIVLSVVGAFLALLTFGASIASAHVTIWPRQSAPGAFEKYVVRVPSERPSPTVRVELDVPDGVTFSRVMPKPGWRYETARNAAGRVTGIVWSGGSIGPEEFDEFEFQARNGPDQGTVAWKARQIYADGVSVAWDGPAGSKNPASFTELKAGVGGDTSHGGGQPATTPTSAPSIHTDTPAVMAEGSNGGGLTLALAGAAFAVGSLALLLSIMGLRRGA